jgi:hypothetical protein
MGDGDSGDAEAVAIGIVCGMRLCLELAIRQD